ncbi:hypothetical protein SEA_CAMERICO_79 [Gordonia phage Camerico]|nr:hypothetical protein SEA_CAMERICO_79 [Gordonia phage Camerico]
MTTVAINCQVCGRPTDHSLSARHQWDENEDHFNIFHNTRRNPMAPTIIQKTWFELDAVMKRAMEWPGPGNNLNPEPSTVEEWCTYLEDRVDYVGITAIGRGLAKAIQLACTPFFEDADQVVALAVKRYQASISGQEMPETPGFMGPGQTGDALRVAATGEAPPEKTSDTPAGSTRQIGLDDDEKPKKKKAAPKAAGGLDQSQIDFIKMSLTSGFTPQQVAATMGITEAQVQEHVA